MERDPAYSPDIEIDHDGRVVYARDVDEGETISIPMHMMEQIARQRLPEPNQP